MDDFSEEGHFELFMLSEHGLPYPPEISFHMAMIP